MCVWCMSVCVSVCVCVCVCMCVWVCVYVCVLSRSLSLPTSPSSFLCFLLFSMSCTIVKTEESQRDTFSSGNVVDTHDIRGQNQMVVDTHDMRGQVEYLSDNTKAVALMSSYDHQIVRGWACWFIYPCQRGLLLLNCKCDLIHVHICIFVRVEFVERKIAASSSFLQIYGICCTP